MRHTENCAAQKLIIGEALRSQNTCPASLNILESLVGRQNIPDNCTAQEQIIEEALNNPNTCPASQNILAGLIGRQNIPGGTLQACSIRPRSKSPPKKKVPADCDCGYYKFSAEPDKPSRKRLPLSSEVPETVIPPPGYRKTSCDPQENSSSPQDNRSYPQENRSFLNRDSPSRDQQGPNSHTSFPASGSNALQVNQKGSTVESGGSQIKSQLRFTEESSGSQIRSQLQDNQGQLQASTRLMEGNQGTGAMDKMKLSQSRILYALNMIRDPVVDYQEGRGVPRNEEVTFVTLITSLCTQAYTAGITILVMLWNLMPLVDGFVYFVRFILDKMIDIIQTTDTKDKAVKGAILFAELTVIFFLIFLIIGLIFMPVYVLIARLFSKVFSMIVW